MILVLQRECRRRPALTVAAVPKDQAEEAPLAKDGNERDIKNRYRVCNNVGIPEKQKASTNSFLSHAANRLVSTVNDTSRPSLLSALPCARNSVHQKGTASDSLQHLQLLNNKIRNTLFH